MKKPSVWRVKLYKPKVGHTTVYIAAHSTRDVLDLSEKKYPGYSVTSIQDEGSIEIFNIENIPEFSHYRIGIRELKPYVISHHVGVLAENIEAAIKLVKEYKPNAEVLSANHCGKVNFVIDLPSIEKEMSSTILVASPELIS